MIFKHFQYMVLICNCFTYKYNDKLLVAQVIRPFASDHVYVTFLQIVVIYLHVGGIKNSNTGSKNSSRSRLKLPMVIWIRLEN